MFINTSLGLSLVAPCWNTLAFFFFLIAQSTQLLSLFFVAIDVSVYDRSAHTVTVGMATQFLILSVLSQAISH